jgi:1-acyl-sn-glycerol-3-phosphate acyltransferase
MIKNTATIETLSKSSTRIPQFFANILFRSFETQELFIEQLERLRVEHPKKPLILCLFNAGLIEYFAVRLFIFNKFGETFELSHALGISRFLQDFFSFRLKRTLSSIGLLRKEKSHLAVCLKSLEEGKPLFLNMKVLDNKKVFEQAPSERYLSAIKKYHPNSIIVPVAFVWKRAPKVIDEAPKGFNEKLLKLLATPLSLPWYFLLGDPYSPKGLRKLLLIMRGYSKSVLRATESFSIQEYEPHVIRRKVYLAIQHEKRVLLGPIYKSTNSVQEEVLGSPSFKSFLNKLSHETGTPEKSLNKRSVFLFNQMAAQYRYFVVEVASWILTRVFRTIYHGVEYDRAELEKIREASKEGTVILIPNHRSYFDFLLLSYVLFNEHFMPPHVAAGINLNFWPIGGLLKRGGAIFIQRSFKGDPLYTEIFRRYIVHLLNNKIVFEFFIEGMRSRNGKAAPPRYGILKMIYEASQNKEITQNLRILPVSITYDVVTEEKAHRRELEGGKKIQESFLNLLGSISFFFKNYGRVHLRFADALPVENWISDKGTRFGLQKLSFEVCHRINEATLLTPMGLVCGVLLAKPGNALSKGDLENWLEKLHADILKLNSPLTPELKENFLKPCRRALARLIDSKVVEKYHLQDGGVGLRVPGKERIQVLYYKNSVIHAFVLAALRGIAGKNKDELLELRNLLEFEFFFPEKEKFFQQIEALPADLNYGFFSHWIDDTLENIQLGLSYLKQSHSLKLDDKTWNLRLMKYGQEKILEFSTKRFEAVNTQSFKAFLSLAQNEKWLQPSTKAKESILGVHSLNDIENALTRVRYFRSKIPDWDTLK